MTALTAGFALSLSLILAIGAQNAFVLRQGLRGTHVFAVCLTCALSDAILIAAGVAGFDVLVGSFPWLVGVMKWGGRDFSGGLRRAFVSRGLWHGRGAGPLRGQKIRVGPNPDHLPDPDLGKSPRLSGHHRLAGLGLDPIRRSAVIRYRRRFGVICVFLFARLRRAGITAAFCPASGLARPRRGHRSDHVGHRPRTGDVLGPPGT